MAIWAQIRVIIGLGLLLSPGSFPSAGADASASRGMGLLKGPDEKPLTGQQHLLVIGINRYQNWDPLQGAVREAQRLKDVLLKRYAFTDANTVVLLDEQATRANIVRQLTLYGERLNHDDSLLMIYCGHGEKNKLTEAGFWIPVDGGRDPIQQANWIPNSEIRDYLKALPAHHVLVIADSCFSGRLLTRQAIEPIKEGHYRRAYELRARQVLTSGSDEPVTDQSDFGDALYDYLLNNREPYIDATGLYFRVRARPANQLVLLGPLSDCGHETGGSYVLFLRIEIVPIQEKPAEPAPTPAPILDIRHYLAATSDRFDPDRAGYIVVTNRFEAVSVGQVKDNLLHGVWRLPDLNEISDWKTASQAAARLGGRLPSLNELKTLISREREPDDWGLINSRFFPPHHRTARFWTREKAPFYNRTYVDFKTGSWGSASESEQNAVLVWVAP
jgi:hypothetical protein